MFIDALNEENDFSTKTYFLEGQTGIFYGRKVLDLTHSERSIWKSNQTNSESERMRPMMKSMMKAGAEGTVDMEGNYTLKAKIEIEWGGNKNNEQEKTQTQTSANDPPDSTDRQESE